MNVLPLGGRMSPRKILRLFHTVRHLKAEQVIYRLYYKFKTVRLTEGASPVKGFGPKHGLSPGFFPPRWSAVTDSSFWGDRRHP